MKAFSFCPQTLQQGYVFVGEQKPVKLKYYDDLERKLKSSFVTFLLGPRYVGKTVGVKLVSTGLGQVDIISLHTPEEMRRAVEVYEGKRKEGAGVKVVVEGTAYRLAYALYTKTGEPPDLRSYGEWLKVKDEKVREVLRDERTVLAKMYEEDEEKLLESLGVKGLDREKKEYLLSMAKWRGYVVIPLLERVVKEYGSSKLELDDLKKVVEKERKLVDFVERFLLVKSVSFRSLFKEHGRDLMEMAAEIAEELACWPLSILLRSILLLVSLRHKGEGVIERILRFREAWRRIPNEIRVLICDEVDEAYGLPPGSCYEFLDDWLNTNTRVFIDELSKYVGELAGRLNEFVSKHEELRTELKKAQEEIEELEKELKELREAVENLMKFAEIQSSLQGLYDAIYPDIRLDITWTRLGVDPVNGRVGQYMLVKSGMFEQYAREVERGLLDGKIVVVHGNRGIGKSVLVRYVLSNLILRNDRLWVITPLPSVPGENRPVKLAHAISSLGIDVILYYDPSGPEVYVGGGVPGAIDRDYIKAVLETYREIDKKNEDSGTAHSKVSAILVIPEDFYESVRDEIIQYKLEDKLVEVRPELNQDDFIRNVIKAYSGCGNVPSTLVEKVKNYSSYTLVAKLAGEWMKGKCDEVEAEIEKILAESANDAKIFIARYIWKVIFFNKNVELAEVEAIPLIIRALWGPTPRKFFENPFIINDKFEIEPVRISRIVREADMKDLFVTWASRRKEDLIEEVLRDIALGNRDLLEKVKLDLKDLVKAIENAKASLIDFLTRRIGHEPKVSKEDKLLEESIIKSWAEYLPKVLGAELRKDVSIGCVRRFLYILGIATTREAFSVLFREFKENVRQLFEVSESCDNLDDWLLVDGEVPSFIRHLFFRSLSNFIAIVEKSLPNDIKDELCRDAEVMKDIITRSPSLRLSYIPYLAGLALTTVHHCRKQSSDLLLLLNCSLSFPRPLPPIYHIFDFPVLFGYIPAAFEYESLMEVLTTIENIGARLGWPEEFAPVLETLCLRYSMITLEGIDALFAKRDSMRPWAKAFLAEIYGKCSYSYGRRAFLAKVYGKSCLHTDLAGRARECADKALELLGEIQRYDEQLWYVTLINTVPYLIGFYSASEDLRLALDMLSQLELATSRLFRIGEKLLQSSEVREYLRWKFACSDKPRSIEEMVYWPAILSYDFAYAVFTMPMSKEVRDTLWSYVGVVINRFAEAPMAIREIITRESVSTKIKAIAGDLSAIKKELEMLWKEVLDNWHAGVPYLDRAAARILAHYLVALAFTNDDWRKLLREYGDLLRTSLDEPYRVVTQLMLNVLGGYEEKPSEEEVNNTIVRLIRMTEVYHPRTCFVLTLKYLSEKNLRLARAALLPIRACKLSELRDDKLLCRPVLDLVPVFEELAEELEKCINGVLSDKARLILARLYYMLF